MESTVYPRNLIVGLGACAVAAGARYLFRRKCVCEKYLEGDGKPTVFLIENATEWSVNCEEIISKIKHSKVIVVHCEYVPREGPEGGRVVAMLQITASPTWVALIRLCKLRSVPEELAELLKDPSIVKVGVAVLDDAKVILLDYKVPINGCLNLFYMALATANIKQQLLDANANFSLASMVKVLLDVEMTQDIEIRCSDWESDKLSDDQIAYAKHEVMYAFKLADKIVRSNWVARTLSWSIPSHLWLNFYLLSYYFGYIDIPFERCRANFIPRLRAKKIPQKVSSFPNKPRDKARRSYIERKAHLNYNPVSECDYYTSTCDNSRTPRGAKPTLADLMNQPGRWRNCEQVHSTPKDNVCIVCGSQDNLVRKSVVPKEYRRYFPNFMRRRDAHDVVLICFRCYNESCRHDNFLMSHLADTWDLPLTNSVGKYKLNPKRKAARDAAITLMKNSPPLSSTEQEELKETLRNFYHMDSYMDSLMYAAKAMETIRRNDDYVSHGRKVVESYSQSYIGLIKFVSVWQQHFRRRMSPKHLPPTWSTENYHEVLAMKIASVQKWDPKRASALMRRIGLRESTLKETLKEIQQKNGKVKNPSAKK
ncbi:exonuclease 3'-5' domain-containing protein 2-like [Tropilaelaps mercedesae]|uniref:Exonuclease 3'-5' domain-containing protein 2-like n=1 Tax=Tropilaelaps mercedesae TaxID=418985 RepID=A0A1V9XTW7_9ACAR|nr:exonuclease 3'-5' domain-containing protein 2-like [Tropilaelaps mercedesae]